MNGFSELEENEDFNRGRVIAGKEVVFDDEGFCGGRRIDGGGGRVLASESGMEALDDARWRVIRFLREYYAYHGRAPMNRDPRRASG